VLTRPTCLSYEYSLPNKLFESIHAGIPVLATRLVDAAALVDEYGVGETVEVDADARELATRIEGVIARTEEYRAAAHRAAFGLAWNHEADRLVEVWAKALGGRAAERTEATA
jgi:glycosyltransferase involved in cell wall biosynthesis